MRISLSVQASAAALLLSLGAMPASQGQEIYDLPDQPDIWESSAWGISGNGQVIVGAGFEWQAGIYNYATRWEVGQPGVVLGTLPGHEQSFAYAASYDGSVIVGRSTDLDPVYVNRAFRWQDGVMTDLGDLSANGDTDSAAYGVSADGGVVVGYSTDGNGDRQAFRWEDGIMSGLGFLDDGEASSEARALSADGTIIVGTSTNSDGFDEAFRWDAGTTMVGLGTLGGETSSAQGISADGTVIVGRADNAAGLATVEEAFRWQDGVMMGLGFLDDADDYSIANDASYNGRVVVGGSGTDSEAGAQHAFIWTEADGMRSIEDILTDAGVDVSLWPLFSATGVSDSGRTIVGIGGNGMPRGWIMRLGDEIGITTPEELLQSAATLGSVADLSSEALASLLTSQSSIARQDSCAASACAYTLGSGFTGSYGLGGLFGLAVSPTDDLTIGGALGLSGAHDDLALGGSVQQAAIAATGYVAFRPETGLQLTAAAGATHSFDIDITRGYTNGVGTATSTGSTTGQAYGATLHLGYAVAATPDITLTPFAEYELLYSTVAGYTETDGPFPVTVSEAATLSQTIRLGLEAGFAAGHGVQIWGSANLAHRQSSGDALLVAYDDLFNVTLPAGNSSATWFEATAGAELPLGDTLTALPQLRAAWAPGTALTYQASMGISAGF